MIMMMEGIHVINQHDGRCLLRLPAAIPFSSVVQLFLNQSIVTGFGVVFLETVMVSGGQGRQGGEGEGAGSFGLLGKLICCCVW
jgi:hypothetical protein